jgi:hypothetical protein
MDVKEKPELLTNSQFINYPVNKYLLLTGLGSDQNNHHSQKTVKGLHGLAGQVDIESFGNL